MHLQARVALAGLLLVSCAAPAAGPTAPPSSTPAAPHASAWERLCTELPGRWQARLGNDVLEVSYRMTARGSVLLETWMPGTAAETLSAYHLDDGAVMLTHYCGQGNQPRLRLSEEASDRLRFTRFDATDLTSDEAALSELDLAVDGLQMRRTEVYTQGDERETTTWALTRSALDRVSSRCPS